MKHRYFDPEGLARIGNMELVAKQVVEGFLSGRHRSPYQGFSVEFMDHRPYTPGDEMRTLDWRLLARTDKVFVKLFQDETNLRAHLVVDASKSMGHGSGKLTKLAYASYLAASLAYLMLRQNDALGLVVFDQGVRRVLPPQAKGSQFRRILQELEEAQPRGETRVGSVLHEIAERITRRGLVILISDLLDDVDEIADGLQHLRHQHHEVIVFQVLDPQELTLPYERMTRFKDMEGVRQLLVNPRSLRAKYLERLGAFLEQVKGECYQRKISYALADTARPYDVLLAECLERRARLG
jgi:uncharacterized protein (DUF58 family)